MRDLRSELMSPLKSQQSMTGCRFYYNLINKLNI